MKSYDVKLILFFILVFCIYYKEIRIISIRLQIILPNYHLFYFVFKMLVYVIRVDDMFSLRHILIDIIQ